MADPISMAVGIVGIVKAVAQASVLLTRFTKSTIAAPKQAQILLTEVSDIGEILSQLQSFLLGINSPKRSRASLLKVDKVVTIVSGCVLTFSELEKLLEEMKTEDLDVLDRLKWAKKESVVVGLVQRLQNHKASLSLMLNILNGQTMAEATNSMDRLHTLVERSYEEMSSRVRALEVLVIQNEGNADLMSVDDTESVATIRGLQPDVSYEEAIDSQTSPFNFLDDLQNSRVYRRNQAFRRSTISVLTDSAYSVGWSFLSGMSMAEISDISVINLAIIEGELFNPGRSLQTWSAQRRKGDSTDSHIDQQHTLPFRIAHEPVRADASAVSGPECHPASVKIQPQNPARDGSLVSKSHPLTNPELATQVNPSSGRPESLTEQDDECYLCKGCGKILEEGKAFELAGNRWHINCFRCNTCSSIIDSDADLIILNDGSLICKNCTYSCSVCNVQIDDLAILTGDQAFCETCFKCQNCKTKIEGSRYARTSQGMFCMVCHESLMLRRRMKALTKRLVTKEKQLPALPSEPRDQILEAVFLAPDTMANSSMEFT